MYYVFIHQLMKYIPIYKHLYIYIFLICLLLVYWREQGRSFSLVAGKLHVTTQAYPIFPRTHASHLNQTRYPNWSNGERGVRRIFDSPAPDYKLPDDALASLLFK